MFYRSVARFAALALNTLGVLLILSLAPAHATFPGTTTKNTITWGGVTRYWWVWKPTYYDIASPSDVIFVLPRVGINPNNVTPAPYDTWNMADAFHQLGGWPPDGDNAAWDSTGAKNQVYVFLFPKATGWLATGDYNDTGLLMNIYATLSQPGYLFNAGVNHYYIASWNTAGDITARLACTAGNQLSGAYFFAWGMKLADQTACTGYDHVIPAMFQYGKMDTAMPVLGDTVRDSVDHTHDWWADKNRVIASIGAPKPAELMAYSWGHPETGTYQPNCNWDGQGFYAGRNPGAGYPLCWYESYIDGTSPPQAQGSQNISPTVYYQHYKSYWILGSTAAITTVLVTGDKSGNVWPGDQRWDIHDYFQTRTFGPADAYTYYPDGSVNWQGLQNYPPNCANTNYGWRSSYPASIARALWHPTVYCIN